MTIRLKIYSINTLGLLSCLCIGINNIVISVLQILLHMTRTSFSHLKQIENFEFSLFLSIFSAHNIQFSKYFSPQIAISNIKVSLKDIQRLHQYSNMPLPDVMQDNIVNIRLTLKFNLGQIKQMQRGHMCIYYEL